MNFSLKLREHGLVGMLGDHAQQVVVKAQCLVHGGTVPVHHALGVIQILKTAKVR